MGNQSTILFPVAADRLAASKISITIILLESDDKSLVAEIFFCNTARK